MSGSGGCNYYFGNCAVSEKAINMVGGMALTQKACTPALMQQDQKLLTGDRNLSALASH
ncbi:META domain-containing protein [Parasphingorhabdus sp.]|uniref:META domain-containing protein n=1 Tax=Parasphingorhabdus sp. TaxID=2709688 RepID=UPI003A943E44